MFSQRAAENSNILGFYAVSTDAFVFRVKQFDKSTPFGQHDVIDKNIIIRHVGNGRKTSFDVGVIRLQIAV
jgi:hypothetical protein